MFGGDDFSNNLVGNAALVGLGAYAARQNPNSSVLGVVGTVGLYTAYFFGGLLIFFIVLIFVLTLFGKKSPNPPPADTTNSASGK